LVQRELVPSEHLLDTTYGSVDLLLESRCEYDIELICPMRPLNIWQSRTESGFDISQFTIDWENQKVLCPQGKVSVYWKETTRSGQKRILAKFLKSDCQICPSKNLCTRRRVYGHRELTFSLQEEHMALQEGRRYQKTPEFKERYAKRAGIEGTISQAVYAIGMRRCLYRGLAKTHLQHVLTACAINIKRVVDWLEEKPRAVSRRRRLLFAQTRKSRFAALAA
jgi:transposase